jgi:tetratricopeptide (TPR) repeat protein
MAHPRLAIGWHLYNRSTEISNVKIGAGRGALLPPTACRAAPMEEEQQHSELQQQRQQRAAETADRVMSEPPPSESQPVKVVQSAIDDAIERGAPQAGDAASAASIRQLKDQGTACFKAKDWAGAYGYYSRAVNAAMESGHAEDIHVLFSNLCAVLLKGNRSDESLDAALGYAQHCCKAAKNWPKSHYRHGQALEAKHGEGCEPARAAFLEACRRSDKRDKLMEAALLRCGGDLAAVRIEVGSEEDLLEEMIDLDDRRLSDAGVEDLPQMEVEGHPSTGRRDQKGMMAGLIDESMQANDAGEYRESIKHAIAAVKLSAVLGEAPAASFAFVQLATAFIGLRDHRKAEAHARSALAIAGASFPTSTLMSAEHPLQPQQKEGVEIPGLSHPCSSYSLKTQAYLLSTAYLTLGNVLSAKLQHAKAVKAYKHALRATARLHAAPGSKASITIEERLASLHNNIGNQYSKENLRAEAIGTQPQP